MKQIAQNLKKGTLTIEEVPVPACKAKGVLVRTLFSAISVGTERMKLQNADMNYLQMARAKPEQFKQVLNTITQQGMQAAYRKVMNKLDSLSPMGYSCAGEVIEVGKHVVSIQVGDLVACGGAGYANHAEVNYIPQNLCARIPDGVSMREASMTTIASIAMQGFRQAGTSIGENIAVIGLGLLGQVLIQLIRANGCRAIGFDLDKTKVNLALEQGAHAALVPEKSDYSEEIAALTGGYGCDAVIITTGTQSNDPIILAGKIARDKARIVDIGITKMDLPWDLYYHKELDFRFSRSYGPGRYDPAYEEGGADYPIGYVRWTEQRNMEAVLQLLRDGRISFDPLITHEERFSDAEQLFHAIKDGTGNFLGVTLRYTDAVGTVRRTVKLDTPVKVSGDVVIGGIGAGNYASTMLYPFLKHQIGIRFKGLATATGLNARDKAGKIGFEYATTDYSELLRDQDINTLVIATRHDQHARMVVQGLEQNKHVFVEKPLALSGKELSEVMHAAAGSKGILMVGYNRRYAPTIRYVKKHLQPGFPYSIYYQVNAGFVPKENWYQSPEQGGRIIGECGHFIDVFQFLLDAKPVEVSASSTRVQDMPEQDNTFLTIRFDNGSSCVLAYLSDGDKNYPKEKIIVSGFRSTIEFDNFRTVKVFRNGKTNTKKFIGLDKGQKEEMISLSEAVRTGIAPIPLESLALTSLTTIRSIESVATGDRQTIHLDNLT